jgi:hypothetical protein
MVWDICYGNYNHGRVTRTTQTKQPSLVMADYYPNRIIPGRIIYLCPL